MSDEEQAQKLISIFVCQKDSDIENFLKEKAILFEKLGKNRTFNSPGACHQLINHHDLASQRAMKVC